MTAGSILIDRVAVSLNKFQLRAVERLYDSSLASQTVVEKITYHSDGVTVKGYLARPAESGDFPTLIWNRGGWRERGGLDALTAHLILASTARWGYVVLATQYRGNFGGEGTEDWGDKDVNDAYNLIRLAEELPECNSEQMVVEGVSRGGITTFRLLTMYAGFKCAIVHAGVSDVVGLAAEDEHFKGFAERRWGHLDGDDQLRQQRKRSVIHFADKFLAPTPVLLMHGTNDGTIPISQSESLAARLTELGHPHEFVKIDGGGHVALKDGSYMEIDRHRKAWLDTWVNSHENNI